LFVSSEYDAYLLGLLSLNGFKLPKSGVLIGFDDQSDLDDVVHVAKTLKGLGFSIHTSQDCQAFVSLVFFFSSSFPVSGLFADPTTLCYALQLKSKGLDAKVVDLSTDRKVSRKVMGDAGIDMVVNVARRKPKSTADGHYLMRRLAVDFGIPLLNDSKCAVLFADALSQKRNLKESVKGWDEYLEPK